MKNIIELQQNCHPLPDQIIYQQDRFVLEVCMAESSKRIAYQMRYRSYVEARMIARSTKAFYHDRYDDEPNTRTFLVWYEGNPVATIRSCVYSERYDWSTTECFQYFSNEVNKNLGINRRILESNRFVVDPDFQGRQSIFARFLLFRAHGLNAAVHECDYIMTSVRANHVAFYQRFLNLHPVSEKSSYIDWVKTEGFLLYNETEQCLQAILKRGMPAYDQKDILHYAKCAQLKWSGLQQKVA